MSSLKDLDRLLDEQDLIDENERLCAFCFERVREGIYWNIHDGVFYACSMCIVVEGRIGDLLADAVKEAGGEIPSQRMLQMFEATIQRMVQLLDAHDAVFKQEHEQSRERYLQSVVDHAFNGVTQGR